jgi:integrase
MARVVFTAPRVTGHKCPPDKPQSFIWDATTQGLGLRVTTAGKPAYIFQGRFQDKTIRITIGSPAAWSIPDAQAKARELQRLIDEGRDPREVKAEKTAVDVAKRTAAKSEGVTVGEVWAVYVEERRPHWGDMHYRDHIRKAAPGGVAYKRGTGTTEAGPLNDLMTLPLRDLTAEIVEAWAAKEAKTRPTSARLAWRMLKVFLGWCEEQTAYAALMPAKNPAKTKKTREHLGKAGTKSDALQREQLAVWFDAVRKIGNPVISAYLQTLLLTGARPGEVISLRWEDLNTKWKGLTIRDKVEGTRVVPLTPYVAHLLAALPRRNDWVFASSRALKMDENNTRRREAKATKDGKDISATEVTTTSFTGHITEPNHAHTAACTVAGIDALTLHGLRRSFKSLSEWLEVPVGVVAQIMGHKPSATAEKHYTVRPLDLLRLHHEKIEAWILEQAGIVFDAKATPGALRVVA